MSANAGEARDEDTALLVVEVSLQFEGERSLQSLQVSQALAEAMARAVLVSNGFDKFQISFSSLFIGLAASPDSLGDWVRQQFQSGGAKLALLLQKRGLKPDDLMRLRETPSATESLRVPLLCSQSARSAVTEGQRLARDLGGVLDTRHVMASYISLPTYHPTDFRLFRIDRLAWAESFAQEMSRRYPTEAHFWQTFHAQAFPQLKKEADADAQASAPNAAPEVPSVPASALDLVIDGTKGHVAKALRLAEQLAGTSAIEAHHAIAAVVSLAKGSASHGFKQFALLSGLPPATIAGDPSGPLPAASRLAADLRNHLILAQRPTAGNSDPCELWGRDLVTAALLCHDPRLAAALEDAGQSLNDVRDLWYVFVTTDASDKHRTNADWNDWWLKAGVPLPEPRRPGYATETDRGDDKLGIEAEARAFARLILDKKVEAPLSIGLLGDWGSGKSFFIEQIKKQTAALKKQGRPELYSNVIEIEFNAWHASDTNLWASLVTYIFDEIWENVSCTGPTRTREEAQRLLIEKITEAKGAVHEAEAQVAMAQSALAKAEVDLEDRKKRLLWHTKVTSLTSPILKKLARDAGWYQSLETINDVHAGVRALAASSNRLHLIGASLIQRPLQQIALPTALLAAGTAALWFVLTRLQADAASWAWVVNLSKWTAGIVGGIGAVVAPLHAATRKVSGLADALTSIQDQYQAALDRATPEERAEITTAQRELANAEATVVAATNRLADLLNQQVGLDPRRRLGEFLHDRVQSTQYRSQQGIISLVHKDFQKLSLFMKDLRESSGESANKDGIKSFDRIVLYVDDLDRCRPDHVVNMLEAVHLLLALDLFVVVVAVDARWLTRALEVHYKELLTGADSEGSDGVRASTPQSYLEKIFQITYALGPMDPKYFGQYVQFLAGADEPPPVTADSADNGHGHATGATGDPNRASAPASTSAAALATAGKLVPESNTATASEPPPKIAMPPAHGIRIDKAEQTLIGQLVPLLPTPRVAKRLVNVYRLIKANKTVAGLDSFQKEGRARSCLLMLAILFGRPALAAQLFREVHETRTPFDNPKEPMADAVRRRAAMGDLTPAAAERWRRLLATLTSLPISASVGECARETVEVARYSLVAGHEWHTWNRSPPTGDDGRRP